MTVTRSRGESKRLPRLEARVKVWLEIDGEYAFGHGLSTILAAVADAGSIKEAAAMLGKSYRHVWHRIKEAEKSLGRQLVQTQVGGKGVQRSSLSPLATQLVSDYDQLRQRMLEVVDQEYASRFKVARRQKRQRPT